MTQQEAKASGQPLFRGAWCPSVTPFNEQGQIDFHALEQHFNRLTQSGIDGILLMGSIGEFATLSMKERLELIKTARKMTNLPMIAHVSSTCVDDMVHLAHTAYEHNYEAVMALPHYYYAQTPVQLLAYYEALDQRFNGNWLIYNFPARTNCDLTANLVVELAKKLPKFVGIKDTVDCASHTRAIVRAMAEVRTDFSIFAGFDEYLVPNLMNGGSGVLSGLNNVVPELFAHIIQAYHQGNLTEVAKLHQEIGRLSAIYTIGEDFVTTIKTTVGKMYGYMGPLSRNYGGALNQTQLKQIDALFDL
ncbi:dihydrodipicolinate synthase family protein [Neisseria sp. Ec49-e6-T10]|uniref:dihydrodipicolinate synthase family protein n=1 Tax=Neisseria sp. Ec49-e6-T10 TaxID=3140744 RepID=UPI003EB7E22C